MAVFPLEKIGDGLVNWTFLFYIFNIIRYLAAVKRAAADLKSNVSRVSLLLAMRICLVVTLVVSPRKFSPSPTH